MSSWTSSKTQKAIPRRSSEIELEGGSKSETGLTSFSNPTEYKKEERQQNTALFVGAKLKKNYKTVGIYSVPFSFPHI